MKRISVVMILTIFALGCSVAEAQEGVRAKGCQSKAGAINFVTAYHHSTADAINRSGLAHVTPEQVEDMIAEDLENLSRYYRIVEDIKDCPGGKFSPAETK